MALSAAKRLLLLDNAATRPGVLTLANVINDASRALGLAGDGLSNDGSTGIWPAATNLVTNGGFETNAIGYGLYTAAGTAGSLAWVNTDAKFGGASLRVITTGDGVGQGFAKTSITGSTSSPYSVSMWVKAPVGALLTLSLAEYLAAAFVRVTGSTDYTGTGNWDRVTFSGTTGAGMDKLIASFYTRTSAQALTFYVDGFQIETGLVPTPYIETDGGTASRSAGRVQMPIAPDMASVNQFWFAGRVRVNQITSNGYLAYWPAATGGIGIVYNTLPKVYVERHQGGFQNVGINGALTVGDYITLIGYGTPSTIGISYNGGAFTTTANALPPITPATSLDLGQSGSGTAFGYFDYLWFAVGNGLLNNASSAAIHAFGNTDPTIRRLDQVARGAHAMAVWDGRTGTFQRRIGA